MKQGFSLESTRADIDLFDIGNDGNRTTGKSQSAIPITTTNIKRTLEVNLISFNHSQKGLSRLKNHSAE
jgi:hypothetical protein